MRHLFLAVVCSVGLSWACGPKPAPPVLVTVACANDDPFTFTVPPGEDLILNAGGHDLECEGCSRDCKIHVAH